MIRIDLDNNTITYYWDNKRLNEPVELELYDVFNDLKVEL